MRAYRYSPALVISLRLRLRLVYKQVLGHGLICCPSRLNGTDLIIFISYRRTGLKWLIQFSSYQLRRCVRACTVFSTNRALNTTQHTASLMILHSRWLGILLLIFLLLIHKKRSPMITVLCIAYFDTVSISFQQSLVSRAKWISFLGDRLSCLSCLSVTLLYCGQTTGWIKMKLDMQLGLGPGHIVLDGTGSPLQRGIAPPQFSAHVFYGQTAGW